MTWALFAACTLIFFLIWRGGPAAKEEALFELGHLKEAVWAGEVWRLMTAVFLHDSWPHLLLNMFVLQSFGRLVERLLGSARFAVLFLASGLGGSLLFQAVSSAGLAVGASGAVAGVVGAFLIVWARFTTRTPGGAFLKFLGLSSFMILGDLVFSFAIQQVRPDVGIAISAHAGGLVTGAWLAFAFRIGDAPAPRAYRRLVPVAAGLLVLAGIALYQGAVGRRGELAERAHLREVRLRLDAGDVDGALASWRDFRPESPGLRSELGYVMLDRILAEGRKELADGLLDEIIQSFEEDLVRREEERGKSPRLQAQLQARTLNDMAWCMALRGRDLDRAHAHARNAVSLAEETSAPGWLHFLFGQEASADGATYLNTQGWIEVLMGRHEAGIEHLAEAARRDPSGPHFLYLAMAHERLGNTREAREAAEDARKAGGVLSPYEKRLLEELEGELGGL